MNPGTHQEISGKIELQTPTGEVWIPVSFEIFNIETDSYVDGASATAFIAPCNPIPNEFIDVETVVNKGSDNVQYPYKVHISWAINTYKVLIWKVSGFTS